MIKKEEEKAKQVSNTKPTLNTLRCSFYCFKDLKENQNKSIIKQKSIKIGSLMQLVGVVGRITPNPKSNGKERLEVED